MRCERCALHPPVIHLSGADGAIHRVCAACLRDDPSLVRAVFQDEATGRTGDRTDVEKLVARLLARMPQPAPAEDVDVEAMVGTAAVSLDERERWRQRLMAWCPSVRLLAPARPAEIAAVEAQLGVRLPRELHAVLAAANGIRSPMSVPVWPTTTIIETNRLCRTELASLYMSFESLLFFGDAGDGDQFAFRVVEGEVDPERVYRWDHEDDSRVWHAASLEQLLEEQLTRARAA